ncbi:MAG TPA: SPOR domain-containing protein [Brumimicrobium sp.]|nr:SPOR domain-containing protein [Brumimicrobium sp.]
MDKYIKQLLELYSKIILPQFGAIVIENEETGELMFNEYLSYDDGKLSELIEKESNMDLQEAKNTVAKFVRELKAQLDKGETYSIFQLGEFSKNKDGEFLFKGNLKTGSSIKTPNKSEEAEKVVSPPLVEKKKEEPTKKEEKVEPKKSEVKNADASKKNIYVEKGETFPKSDSDKVKESQPKKETKEEKKKKEKVKKEKVVVPKKEKPKKEPKNPEEKKKKRPFLWILLLILVILAGSSIYIGLNYEKVEEYMGWNKFDKVELATEEDNTSDEVLPEDTTPIEDEIITDETVQEEMITEDIVEEKIVENEPVKATPSTPISQTSKGNHHIIVGCFSEISNAQDLVSKFKGQGFDAKIIGQYGGLHFVSAQSYPSTSEASANLSRVKQVNGEAWIFRN